MSTTDEQRLGEELLRGRILTESQLRTIEEYRASLGGRFQDIIVKLGFVPEERLNAFLTHREHTQAIDLNACDIDQNAMRQIPRELVETHAVIAVAVENPESLLLAMNVLDLDVVEEVQSVTNRRVSVGMAPRSQILERIARFYDMETSGGGSAQPSDRELIQMISDPVVAAMARALVDAGVLDPDAWSRELNAGQ